MGPSITLPVGEERPDPEYVPWAEVERIDFDHGEGTMEKVGLGAQEDPATDLSV